MFQSKSSAKINIVIFKGAINIISKVLCNKITGYTCLHDGDRLCEDVEIRVFCSDPTQEGSKTNLIAFA